MQMEAEGPGWHHRASVERFAPAEWESRSLRLSVSRLVSLLACLHTDILGMFLTLAEPDTGSRNGGREEEAGEAWSLAWCGAVEGSADAHGNAVFLRPLLAKGEGASVGPSRSVLCTV